MIRVAWREISSQWHFGYSQRLLDRFRDSECVMDGTIVI